MASHPLDYSSFFNPVTERRHISALRSLYDTFKIDDSYVLMGGGLPNEKVFPITGIRLTLLGGEEIDIPENEVSIGQQYGTTRGNKELLEFTQTLVKLQHDPPTWNIPDHPGAHKIIMTSGAQDGIFKTFEALLGDGDAIIYEEYAYSGFIALVKPLNASVLRVKMDNDGIILDDLRTVLSNWYKPENGKPSNGKVKVLYCIPNGHNPSGSRYTVERKREIYRLAQQYNFLIVEDDAYYFLDEKPYVDSFLSMDVDGRVIRVDTFSKTVGPGFRVAYVTAPEPIYTKLHSVSMVSTMGCCPISQILLAQLVRNWGKDGYLDRCDKLYEFYKERRQSCDRIARKHLQGLADWSLPSGGMFLWMKLPNGIDSDKFFFKQLVPRKVVIVAGCNFVAGNDNTSSCIRVSFSNASDDHMEKGFAIIAEEIRNSLQQNIKE